MYFGLVIKKSIYWLHVDYIFRYVRRESRGISLAVWSWEGSCMSCYTSSIYFYFFIKMVSTFASPNSAALRCRQSLHTEGAFSLSTTGAHWDHESQLQPSLLNAPVACGTVICWAGRGEGTTSHHTHWVAQGTGGCLRLLHWTALALSSLLLERLSG